MIAWDRAPTEPLETDGVDPVRAKAEALTGAPVIA
jgi:hypothetical protein